MGKFRQFLTQLSAHDTSIFSCFWTITQVNIIGFSLNLLYTLLLEIWFGIAGLLTGKICQFLTELSAHKTVMAGYFHFTFYSTMKLSYFSIKTYIVGIDTEAVLLGIHNIYFQGELQKIIPQFSLNTPP